MDTETLTVQVCIQLVQMWVRPSAVRECSVALTWQNVRSLSPPSPCSSLHTSLALLARARAPHIHTKSICPPISLHFIVIQWGTNVLIVTAGWSDTNLCSCMQSECIVSTYIRSRIVLYLLPSAVALLRFVPPCVLFQLIIASSALAPLSRLQFQWVLSSRGRLDFFSMFKFFIYFFYLPAWPPTLFCLG